MFQKPFVATSLYSQTKLNIQDIPIEKIYAKAPPSTTHQRISNYIFSTIYQYIHSNTVTGEVFSAPFGVYLNENDVQHYVVPDICVICDTHIIEEKGCYGAPDWIIEIVSPNHKGNDYKNKYKIYSSSNVREYWIVDPNHASRRIIVHNLEDGTHTDYTFSDKIYSLIYEDLCIDFSQISIK